MGSADAHAAATDGGKDRAQGQFLVGEFCASFRERDAARAAARDARAVGFVVDVQETGKGRWAMLARRKEPVPHDEQQRYAARLRAIAGKHGGTYTRFVREPAK